MDEKKKIKRTAQEVPVQEQLNRISQNIKWMQITQFFYFTSIMTTVGLLAYRFNKVTQGFVDILQGNVDITRSVINSLETIADFLKVIVEIIR